MIWITGGLTQPPIPPRPIIKVGRTDIYIMGHAGGFHTIVVIEVAPPMGTCEVPPGGLQSSHIIIHAFDF